MFRQGFRSEFGKAAMSARMGASDRWMRSRAAALFAACAATCSGVRALRARTRSLTVVAIRVGVEVRS